MVSYLLDTNVLSELRRPRPDRKVAAWTASVPITQRHISVLSLGEMTNGIVRLLKRDPQRAEFYRDWLVIVREQYEGRVLLVDALVAETWGMMVPTGSFPIVDALILSTARAHGLVLATRNRRDFDGLGIKVINPWTD